MRYGNAKRMGRAVRGSGYGQETVKCHCSKEVKRSSEVLRAFAAKHVEFWTRLAALTNMVSMDKPTSCRVIPACLRVLMARSLPRKVAYYFSR